MKTSIEDFTLGKKVLNYIIFKSEKNYYVRI